jgi:acyl carrier protein
MWYLRQQGAVAPGVSQMRFLPGETGNCPERKSIIDTERGKMDELFEKMKKLIADKLEVDEGKITMDASFRQDLGADSLDTYELVYAIEEEMGISIPDAKANEFETVKDAYEYIKSQQK